MKLQELLEKSPHKTATISILISLLGMTLIIIQWLFGALWDNASADYIELSEQVDENSNGIDEVLLRLESIDSNLEYIKERQNENSADIKELLKKP